MPGSRQQHQHHEQQPRQGQPSADLNFITFGEPQQSKSTRAIRSHAAKAGWKSRKNSKAATAAARALPVHPTTETTPAAQPSQTTSPVVPSWPSDVATHNSTPSLSSSSSRSSLSTHSSCSTPVTTHSPSDVITGTCTNNVDSAKLQLTHVDQDDLARSTWHTPTDLSLSHSQSSIQALQHPIGSVHDPFSQFPVKWESSFGTLVNFYRNCLGEVWLKLISADWGRQGNIDFVDFPLQISINQREPAMFYAVMSNSSVMAPASNAISMRQQPFLSQWLRHKAVESLREAIADPNRAYTDAVICTVDFVYLNEALRGEHEIAQKVHGPALIRMVAARGGLRAIASGGKDGLILSRMLSWADRIVASTLNIPPLFPDYVEDPSVGQTQWTGIWSKVQTLM